MFNAFRSAYEVKVWPQAQAAYLALLSLRHPNVSSSFRLAAFRLTAAPDPELAAAPAPGAATSTTSGGTTSTTTTTLAAPGPVFNPLLHPRINLVVAFPKVGSASEYGGGPTKLLGDFRAIVASTAALTGPDWVVASLIASTPATVNATVRAHTHCARPAPCARMLLAAARF